MFLASGYAKTIRRKKKMVVSHDSLDGIAARRLKCDLNVVTFTVYMESI